MIMMRHRKKEIVVFWRVLLAKRRKRGRRRKKKKRRRRRRRLRVPKKCEAWLLKVSLLNQTIACWPFFFDRTTCMLRIAIPLLNPLV